MYTTGTNEAASGKANLMAARVEVVRLVGLGTICKVSPAGVPLFEVHTQLQQEMRQRERLVYRYIVDLDLRVRVIQAGAKGSLQVKYVRYF